MSRLLVVSCGGTISSIPGAGGRGAVPTLSAEDLVSWLAGGSAEVQTLTYSTVASSAMATDDVVGLFRALSAWADATGPDALGIVITHGTDTLEEVAFGLDLLWDRPLPVVVTGAMRHPGLPSPDGPGNLLAAVATASSPEARDAGVLVVADDRIHLAGTVRKAHTSDVSAFRSATLGPVGYLVEGRARLLLHRRRPAPLPVPAAPLGDHPVAVLTMSLGDDGRLLPALGPAGYRGLVVEGLGGGHVPPAVAAVLPSVLAAMPVVLASRVGAGETLRATYGFPGSEQDLLARGVLGAGRLGGPQARVLLTLLLAAGADRAAIAAAFAEHGGG